MKLGPAKDRSHGTTKQHRVEQNEAADSSVGVLAENHERNKPDGGLLQLQLLSSIVCHGDTDNAEESIERAHEGVVELLGVFLARLEFECAIVTSQDSRETN